MDAKQRISLLARTQLFGALDEDSLSQIAAKLLPRRYKKRELVFSRGDLADSLFLVVEGLVKVYVTSEEGEEMVLVTLKPPDVFGELALVDGGPRSASAEAVEPSLLLSLGRTTFLELRQAEPRIAEAVDRALGSLLRRLTDQTADLVFLDLHGRVAKLLLGLVEQHHGDKVDQDIALDLQLTQKDIAGMVGGSRQSVNQILKSFAGRGYLELEGRKLVLKRPDLLRRRAGM